MHYERGGFERGIVQEYVRNTVIEDTVGCRFLLHLGDGSPHRGPPA